MSLAVIFPGQGSQTVGMGRDFFNQFDRSKAIFSQADDALGYELSKIIFEGSEDELRLTMNTQPSLLTMSMVVWDIISVRFRPSFFAGHSLGEYSAVVAAGGLSFTDAVKAVHNRGKFMQEAVPVGVGAMAAVLGMNDLDVVNLCKELSTPDSIIEPANFNCYGQIVVAGHASAFENFTKVASERGAKRVVMLSVSAPFHCSLMEPAKVKMAEYLSKLEFTDLKTPIINNIDSRRVVTKSDVVDGLTRQVAGAVRWTESIRFMMDSGVTRFIEVGSGSVLTGLVRKISKEVEVFSISKVEDLENIETQLS